MIGVDLSSFQGRIDGSKMKAAGVRFAFIKLTEGTNYVNPYAVSQIRACRQNGIKVGLYHFARPDRNSAAAEAQHFLRHLSGLLKPGDLLPVLDFEHPPASARWAFEFLQTVEKRIGAKPIFYSYPAFISQMRAGKVMANYPLWLASYGANDGRNHGYRPVAPWTKVAIHQYTSNGRVAGISGRVDMNSASDIRPFLYKAGTVPAPPPAPKPKPVDPPVGSAYILMRDKDGEKRWEPLTKVGAAKRFAQWQLGKFQELRFKRA